jgi:hypothetical protein
MREGARVPLMVLVAVIALSAAGCGSGTEASETSSKFSSSSPEYQLASIDLHGGKPSDEEVERYVSVLDQLQHLCTDSKQQLADWASGIKTDIAPRDSEMRLLSLALEQVRRVEAKGATRSSCREVFLVVGVAAKGGA